MLAVMNTERPKEFLKPGQAANVDFSQYTLATRSVPTVRSDPLHVLFRYNCVSLLVLMLHRPLQRFHYIGYINRKHIMLSMPLPVLDTDDEDGNVILDTAPDRVVRQDSVEMKAQRLLKDGIINQRE